VTRTLLIALAAAVLAADSTPPRVTLELADYVAMPITGTLDGKGQTDNMLARVNSMREEPGRTTRFFINDLNGPLYILDKRSKQLTTYLDFNGRDGHRGIFHKLAYDTGFAGGFTSIQFDPDYAHNGRFYTVHIEDPALPGSNAPDNANLRSLNLGGYQTTTPVPTPGDTQREGVLVEWTDTNPSNAAFEGRARELLRIRLNTRIHPLADISFNPSAARGDAEWRVIYLSCGDGGSGESRLGMRQNPQRLDTLVGKILRIVPDLSEHQATSAVSENGRYRIPDDNPFVRTAGARKEIWAYGFRNPHRLAWAIDPGDGKHATLIADSIGLHTWETINIVHKGANYGYSQREGNERLRPDNRTEALPDPDAIPVQISDAIVDGTVTPTYPVIQYGHVKSGGDAVGDGVLYRGTRIPALQGKYVFTDIAAGRIWYSDYAEMLAADDGNPQTMAAMHPVSIRWNGTEYDSMLPVVTDAYHSRGGKNAVLNGHNAAYGDGRADLHIAVDAAGELFLFTKNDGMIRIVTGQAAPAATVGQAGATWLR
jgi:glucose/sorbosone dehydrogenase